MAGQVAKAGKETPRLEIPEDVAVLYAWANLQGARYRDFSASRRESRAQVRQRAAQARREAEMAAKARAEHLAAEAEAAALQAAAEARFHEAQAHRALGERRTGEGEREQAVRERAMQEAATLTRRAAQERLEVSRHMEALRAADEATRRESHEVQEAHAAAERQAQRYAAPDVGPDVVADLVMNLVPDPSRAAPAGELPDRGLLDRERLDLSDPYTRSRQPLAAERAMLPDGAEEQMLPERFPKRRDARALALELDRLPAFQPLPAPEWTREEAVPSVQARSDIPEIRALLPELLLSSERPGTADVFSAEATTLLEETARAGGSPPMGDPQELEAFAQRAAELRRTLIQDPEIVGGAGLPAWIEEHSEAGAGWDPVPRRVMDASALAHTLQHTRERVASRWYALRGVFDPAAPDMEPTQARSRGSASPLLAIFSLAGGVGKTSLAAALGRSLSASGERVLLADITLQSVLPFYFGATERRHGVLRTFSPPAGSTDAPISLFGYDLLARPAAGDEAEERLLHELQRGGEGYEHVIADLGPAGTELLRRMLHLGAAVLVPVVPDMNAVISLGAIEEFFGNLAGATGTPIEPQYLLTQFEPSLPLHLDIREVMRERLGSRLLPFVVRHAPAVAEALAEGMTVIDYAPDSGVTADYRNLARWFRRLGGPARPEPRAARWSER